MEISQIVVEILQSGPKWCNDRQILLYREPCAIAWPKLSIFSKDSEETAKLYFVLNAHLQIDTNSSRGSL